MGPNGTKRPKSVTNEPNTAPANLKTGCFELKNGLFELKTGLAKKNAKNVHKFLSSNMLQRGYAVLFSPQYRS
jgi:hypothetical protein